MGKYNGRGNADETNGDGIQSGAGTVIPDNYPSIESLLTMAKECSGKFVEGGEYGNEYAVWMPDEELSGYENQAAYYYFIWRMLHLILTDLTNHPMMKLFFV